MTGLSTSRVLNKDTTQQGEKTMRKRMLTALFVATMAIGPAAAQPADTRGGVATETEDRLAQNNYNPIWDLVGCIGLLGLFGFYRPYDNDGYTDDPI